MAASRNITLEEAKRRVDTIDAYMAKHGVTRTNAQIKTGISWAKWSVAKNKLAGKSNAPRSIKSVVIKGPTFESEQAKFASHGQAPVCIVIGDPVTITNIFAAMRNTQ